MAAAAVGSMLRLDVCGGGYFASRRAPIDDAVIEFILRTGKPPALTVIMANQARLLADRDPAGNA